MNVFWEVGGWLIMISVQFNNLSIELCNIFSLKEQKKAHNGISDVAEKSNKKYDFMSRKWHNFENCRG